MRASTGARKRLRQPEASGPSQTATHAERRARGDCQWSWAAAESEPRAIASASLPAHALQDQHRGVLWHAPRTAAREKVRERALAGLKR